MGVTITSSAPLPISAAHATSDFDCGDLSLNDWLRKRAVRNDLSGASRTYVVCVEHAIVGYYCLSAGAVAHVDAPKVLRRNMPEPIPVLVMGRLAVDLRYQGSGIGKGLLRDAIVRCAQAAEIVGVTALLVHALSEPAKRFYISNGFVESGIMSMTLCLPLKTARTQIASAQEAQANPGSE